MHGNELGVIIPRVIDMLVKPKLLREEMQVSHRYWEGIIQEILIAGAVTVPAPSKPIDVDIILSRQIVCFRVDELTAAQEGGREVAICMAEPRSTVKYTVGIRNELLIVRSHYKVEYLIADFSWDFTEEWAVFLRVDGIRVDWSHGCTSHEVDARVKGAARFKREEWKLV